MHELRIAQAIVRGASGVARRHGDVPVRSVHITVGALRAVLPDALRLAFEAASAGTLVEGALLVIEEVPATGRCRECTMSFETFDLAFVCPACGSGSVETECGLELVLESVDLGTTTVTPEGGGL